MLSVVSISGDATVTATPDPLIKVHCGSGVVRIARRCCWNTQEGVDRRQLTQQKCTGTSTENAGCRYVYVYTLTEHGSSSSQATSSGPFNTCTPDSPTVVWVCPPVSMVGSLRDVSVKRYNTVSYTSVAVCPLA